MVKNILTPLSLDMTKTPVVYVIVMEVKLSAPKYLVMESVATPTHHLANAVENVNVCKLESSSQIPSLSSLVHHFHNYKMSA